MSSAGERSLYVGEELVFFRVRRTAPAAFGALREESEWVLEGQSPDHRIILEKLGTGSLPARSIRHYSDDELRDRWRAFT